MDEYSAADENWEVLRSFFPANWAELAQSTDAIKGLRQDKSPENLLRTMLLHVGCGYSLRETVVRARQASLADLSDVALLKRLRKCENWLYALSAGLWEQRELAAVDAGGRSMRVVDASTVKEPGATGSQWRIHYSMQLPSLRCDFFKVTATEGAGSAEGFWQIPIKAGEYLLADRGYSVAQGIVPVAEAGAFVLIRLNQGAVRLLDSRGQRLNLLPKLKTLTTCGKVGHWKAHVEQSGTRLEVRICAVRKTEAAIEKAQRALRRRASKNSTKLKAGTLEYAKYVVMLTTFPAAEFTASQILDWYRLRWQIELVFKRFKQIANLGHLPKHDDGSARAWLYGKLVVSLLTEKLVAHAESFSPWGYEPGAAAHQKPMA